MKQRENCVYVCDSPNSNNHQQKKNDNPVSVQGDRYVQKLFAVQKREQQNISMDGMLVGLAYNSNMGNLCSRTLYKTRT